MRRINRRQFTRLGLGAIGAMAAGGLGLSSGLLLTGCGERSAREAAGRVPLKLGYLPITDHLLLIAHAHYDFAHLAIEPVKFGSWPEAAEALRAGAIDAAFLLTPLGLTLRGQGSPVQAVLLGHRNGSVLTVAVGDRVAEVGDLAGKTIAIPSRLSTHYLLLRRLLALPLGLVFGWYSRLHQAFDPLIQVLRPISPVAWFPLAVLWFKIGDLPAILIMPARKFPLCKPFCMPK